MLLPFDLGEEAVDVLNIAAAKAKWRGQKAVFPLHVLWALLYRSAKVKAIFENFGRLDDLVAEIDSLLPIASLSKFETSTEIGCSSKTKEVIEEAVRQMEIVQVESVTPELLLLGLIKVSVSVRALLKKLGINGESIKQQVLSVQDCVVSPVLDKLLERLQQATGTTSSEEAVRAALEKLAAIQPQVSPFNGLVSNYPVSPVSV